MVNNGTGKLPRELNTHNFIMGYHLRNHLGELPLAIFTFANEELLFSASLHIFSVLFFFHQIDLCMLNSTIPDYTLSAHQVTVHPEFQIKELWLGTPDNTVIIFFTVCEQQHCLGQEML